MLDRRVTVVLVLLVVVLGRVALEHGSATGDTAASAAPGSEPITAAQRRAPMRFAADVHPYDRQVILAAIARARPEARRLIGIVDGLTTMRVGVPPGRAAGLTRGAPGAYDVTVDLGGVLRHDGQRGVDRVVWHELGHVVDHALVVPAGLAAGLDAGIPRGYACEPGVVEGACAPREERFAETFAKWATGDIGIELYLGYKVPPPGSLEEWGAPLARCGDAAATRLSPAAPREAARARRPAGAATSPRRPAARAA